MSKKRLDILYKAIELFNEFGYVNVGVDRIILESKVAKMTFYKYFPSKDCLIYECLKLRDNLLRADIENFISTSNNSPANKLKKIFDWHHKWFNNKDFFGCMFIKAVDELHTDTASLKVTMEHKQWFSNLIKNILIDMKIDNSDVLALQIRMIIDGSIINEHLFKSKDSILVAWELVENLINPPPQ